MMRRPPLSLTHNRYVVAPLTGVQWYVGVAVAMVPDGASSAGVPGADPPLMTNEAAALQSLFPLMLCARTHQVRGPIPVSAGGVRAQTPPPPQPALCAEYTCLKRVPALSLTQR